MSPVPPWKLGVHRRWPGRKLPERSPLCSSLRVAQQVGFGSGQGVVMTFQWVLLQAGSADQ